MDLATLGIRIDSNGVVKATTDLKGVEGQAKRTEDSVESLSRAFRMLAPVVGAVMAAFSIRALTGYADAWSDMQSRVGAAVKNMEAAPALMERLVEVANASYSPLAQTVEIYGRNVAVLRDLGRGATEAADFTEALNHALVTTATKGQDADVVLNALSRSISTGKLRAMEYETIMSRSPRVLEAVADAMGTTVTGLRQMAVDGKVTGGVIVDALIGSLEQLREEAGEMPATIGDALVRIQTNFGALVGRVDQATGASENFAVTLIGLADSIRNMTDDVVRAAVVTQTIFGATIDSVTGLVASLGIEFDGMATLIIAGAGAAGFAITTLGFVTLRTMAMITAALAANPFALMVGFIAAAVAAVYIWRDEIKQLIGVDFVGIAKDAVNIVIGVFVGGFRVIAETGGATWEAVVTSANAMPVGLQAVWENIKAGFMNMVAEIAKVWRDFLLQVSAGLSHVPGALETARAIATEANRIDASIHGFSTSANRAREAAAGFREESASLASEGLGKLEDALGKIGRILGESLSEDYLGEIGGALRQVWDNAEDALATFTDLTDKSDALAGAIDGVGGSLSAANDNLKEMGNIGQRVIGRLSNAFTDMFEAAIIGGKDFGQIMQSLLLDLGRMFANQAFQFLLGGMGGGGGGGLLGGFLIPGILHGGGVAGVDGYGHNRALPASIWAGAERYHNGTMGAGLGPNEIPAILERGEIVLPANSNVAPQRVQIDISVSVDENGNIVPVVKKVAGIEADVRVAQALPVAVTAARVQAANDAPGAVARFQNDRYGSDYRV